MTRGVAHPPEFRAEVQAAVLAGMTIGQAALRFGVSKSLVSEWTNDVRTVRTDQGARDPAQHLGDLIVGLIGDHIAAIQAQLQAASRADWLEKQSAAELAQLVAVERDTAIRLLAGLRPIESPEDQPQLDAPGPSESA